MKNLNKTIQQILTVVALLTITNTNSGMASISVNKLSLTEIKFNSDENSCNTMALDIPCGYPKSDTFKILSDHSVLLTWANNGYNSIPYGYEIRIRTSGSTSWTAINVVGAVQSKTIYGLIPVTTYEYQIKTFCDASGSIYSPFSSIKYFTTFCHCDIPSDLNSNTVTSDSATVIWTGNNCAVKYRLQYRVNGTTTWSQKIVDAPVISKIITNLSNNTLYQYRVRSDGNSAGSIHSSWSDMQTFNTSLRIEDVKVTPSISALNIFPNPSNGNILLILNSNVNENATLRITDAIGKEVLRQELPLNEGENNFNFALNDLATGIYLVRFESLQGIVYNKLLLNK